MIRAALAFTLPWFAIGAVLMALGARGRAPEVVRARGVKLVFFFLIVHGVVAAAAAGRTALAGLALAIALVGGFELARALRRLAPAERWPVLPALALVVAFLAGSARLAPARTLYLFLTVAAFDGFSQVVGQLLGRTPLAPALSPAKTVEGLAGGLAGSVLAALALRGLPGLPAGLAAGAGFGIGLAALAGDLAGSWTKRRAGIKDFSGLLPGQGGVLDRFNSFIAAVALAGPFF